MHYSKSTGGFYDLEIYGTQLPSDAIEITSAEHTLLLVGQAGGRRISAGSDGRPVLSAQIPATTVERSAQVRRKRDALILETDYLLMPDYPATPTRLTAIKIYRQALRDVPAQGGFPQTVNWPVKP